ncbi:MAG: PolC-type DNA polymerase III [Mogibacterium sp.]|nr:PolC-type DNA polymerase III [Mogibacterium sp.]
MKDRVMAKVGYAERIKVNYTYTGIRLPDSADYEGSGAGSKNGKGRYNARGRESGGDNGGSSYGYGKGFFRKNDREKPAFENSKGELVLLGADFNGAPNDYEELADLVGSSDKAVIEGEIFKKDTTPIKNGRVLITMLIAFKAKTFGIKAYISTDKLEEINDSLGMGDMIRARGTIEYDTYEHENLMIANSIKKVEKIIRADTYPNGRRVELHCHSKMSDNDGFNEAVDIVRTAAYWGQPAVAITDHGVVQAFPDAMAEAKRQAKNGKEIKVIYGLEGYLYPDEDALDEKSGIDLKKNRTFHIVILAKNQIGLKNIYKLVSLSHIDYFYKRPRIPRSVLNEYREGLIIGSACEAGELYQAVIDGKSDEELLEIASFYDYLEIQPLGNNRFLIEEGKAEDDNQIRGFNLKIIEIGDKLGKPTVATTDSHYPNQESAVYRNIIMHGIGFRDTPSDSLYLRTTQEMMEEFAYLGDRAEEIVITNTNKIADMVEEVKPIPDGKYPPKIEGAEDKLRESCYEKAMSIYGNPLPPDVAERLEVELNSIISNGYAVMYIAAKLLVEKSLSDGYLVGSRGSVGSSLAATMAGITEVNPLPPHYICPECKKYIPQSELGLNYDTGYDMPDKECPDCGAKMKREGLNIPFATFLGFTGNKEPDIDLNFAGEYQGTAHKYVGEIFGDENVFKAGTVATIADKTAFGYVKHYVEDNHINAGKYDIEYLVKGCMGVKRTTGQHPGGIIVVPADHEIYEFCPIQKPANKRDSDVITTHFDYHKIEANLLKLDILGHDVPQMIRHLQLMTGVNPMSIPMDDRKTLSIFTSLDELKIKNEHYKFTHGTYAIPEFGTNFTRQMLDDIKPDTVEALIKMSGFSHGTDVWTNNAQDLIRSKTASISEVISCRDDIMTFLISKGLDNADAFKIMEIVRKNKKLSDEQLALMKEHGVPDWYIRSCETLKYMFPRAHAAAYVMMSIRMAWFKVYYPEAFYAAWFTSKVDSFDADAAVRGIADVERRMWEIEKLGFSATGKEKEHLIVYEVMYEAMSRGFEFEEPRLGVSEPCRFSVLDGRILMPFNAISGIGDAAAESLSAAYEERNFHTIDDVRSRTRLSINNIEDLRRHGLFEGLPESAQMTIFEL